MAEEKQVEKNQTNVTTDEQVEDVSGGAIFDASNPNNELFVVFSRSVAGDRRHPWEVLDDVSGNVLARFGTKKEAQDYCQHYRVSPKRIRTMAQVEQMRDAWNQHQEYYGDSDPNWTNPHGVLK